MKTSSKRVGLVGFGLGGSRFHAPLIDATDGLELAAIVTSDAGRAGTAAERFGSAEILPDVDELAGRADDLDAVVVASPNRFHVEIAHRFIGLGKAVVVDKPLAIAAADAESLVAAANDKGVPLTVFQNRRWDGDFLTVRSLIEDGTLGDIVRFESRFDKWAPSPTGRARESGDPADGGGLLLDLGSHLVDQAVELFGPVGSVTARLTARVGGADDEDLVLLHHRNGVESQVAMSVLGSMPVRRFAVTGTLASYVKEGLDVQESQLAGGMRPGDPGWGTEGRELWGNLWRDPHLGPEPVETLPGQWELFYAGMAEMLEGGPPPVDPLDSVGLLRVLEAARFSAAERQTVDLG